VKVALVNPRWSFEGSIYFGCREPHLPLEYGYAKALLEAAGHEAVIIDGHLGDQGHAAVRAAVDATAPDLTVLTTAPSYLCWRCAPPELRVPMELRAALDGIDGALVAVGPHASTTPLTTLRKLRVDAVVMGECEEILVRLADTPLDRWSEVPSIARGAGGQEHVQGGPHASDLATLPPLRWDPGLVARHRHHHHRFEAPPAGPGAELEVSRGCLYHCTFCAKDRDRFRKRPLAAVMDELDALTAQGVRYVYFIDEIFAPDPPLLAALGRRRLQFGVQLRIDNWSAENLTLLGRAGCASIEAGVENITPARRERLAKHGRLSAAQLSELLVHAKRHVPFVQANLLDARDDDPAEVEAWRQRLLAKGVWVSPPVPRFPYPGSPDYAARWGSPDDQAWERALAHYLGERGRADLQDERPRPLAELEHVHHG
jgi:B12-binding domain/radical SAM domain protein of rhizo-twelve system